jgi:glycosyltransferase involved in cell wall biosynthesis
MPVVIKEAMAVGMPVVSTREVGVPEMVDDQVGRLARPADPASLADAIAEILVLTVDERTEMGRRGRARVCERFNVRTETARLRALLEGLAA